MARAASDSAASASAAGIGDGTSLDRRRAEPAVCGERSPAEALSASGRMNTAVFVLRKTAQEQVYPADRRRVYLAASSLLEEAGGVHVVGLAAAAQVGDRELLQRGLRLLGV